MYPVPAAEKTFGLSETIIGEWIRSLSPADQQKISITTKFPNYTPRLPYLRKSSHPYISYDELKDSLTGSLRRLGVEVIDRFIVHWPARTTTNFGSFHLPDSQDFESPDIESSHQTFFNLHRLVSEGYVRNIGISNETPLGLSLLISALSALSSPFSLALQNPYSLLSPFFEIALEEMCRVHNIYFMAYSPLAFGVLASQQGPPSLLSRQKEYAQYFSRYSLASRSVSLLPPLLQLATQHNMSLAELAYRYILTNKGVHAVVCGFSDNHQITSTIEFFKKGPLPLDIIASVRHIQITNSSIAW